MCIKGDNPVPTFQRKDKYALLYIVHVSLRYVIASATSKSLNKSTSVVETDFRGFSLILQTAKN